MKVRSFVCIALVSFALASASLFAQSFEVNPYAGYVWPGTNDTVGQFTSNQLLGIRGGGYITKNFELGANWNWNNHFQPASSNGASSFAGVLGFPQGKVRSNLWEAEFTYHFAKRNLLGGAHAVKPYVVLGAGDLRTTIKDNDIFVMSVRAVQTQNNNTVFVPKDVLQDADNFFTFSYGGGVKASHVWGPVGFFGDIRGRSVPNFFGNFTNWPELSAGLNFSWGER